MLGPWRRVERRQGVAPRLAVPWHVVVVPAIGDLECQSAVDLGQHVDARVVVLGEQPVEQWRAGDRALVLGEEAQRRRRSEPAQHHALRDLVPVVRLAEHVVAVEATLVRLAVVTAGRPPAAATAASSPMPPTTVTSSGANTGGPISAL